MLNTKVKIHKRPIKTLERFNRDQDEEPNVDDGVDSSHPDGRHIATWSHFRQTLSSTEPTIAPSPDSLDKFFAGIADTRRTFPKHEIAKIKLNISTLVGQTEVKLSRPEQNPLPMVYIPATNIAAAADIPHQNIYDQATNDNQTIAASTVLIITKNETNEIVHDLTMDDWHHWMQPCN